MQLCAAYRAAGGKTVAVLSCRPKLEMEELFASTIPRSRRYMTRFVFRQVSAHHSAAHFLAIQDAQRSSRTAQIN